MTVSRNKIKYINTEKDQMKDNTHITHCLTIMVVEIYWPSSLYHKLEIIAQII